MNEPLSDRSIAGATRSLIPRRDKGFALIATLSLMVLLSLLGVGLLTLSSISLRESGRSTDRQTAMSNARLALQVALGELQRHAGPDQRITAPAEVLGDGVVRPRLVGVWESHAFDPAEPVSDAVSAKERNFLTWLTSDPRQDRKASRDYAKENPVDSVVMLSGASLANPDGEVTAARVPLQDSSDAVNGSYAYAVFDEGAKARINLGHAKPTADLASRAGALGGGQRPGIDRLADTGDAEASRFNLDEADGRSRMAKLVSLHNADIGYAAQPGAFARKFHDLTPHSLGIMTNVAAGGLKQDLGLIAEVGATAAGLGGKRVYQNAYGLSVPSDPSWDQLLAMMNLYRGSDTHGPYLSQQSGVPVIRATAPSNWNAGSGTTNGPATPNSNPPTGPVLMPSIAKVQMIFSLCARDVYRYPEGSEIDENTPGLHAPWSGFFQYPINLRRPQAEGGDVKYDSEYDYLLHLIYTPVVTLHNPYNVPIEFKEIRVEFVDIPFSLQVFRDGQAQTNGLVPFSGMYFGGGTFDRVKRFGLNLVGKDISNVPDGSMVRMEPGEVLIFSPYIPPNRNWNQESGDARWFSDIHTNNDTDGKERISGNTSNVDTSKAIAIAGWRGDGVGFDLDSFAPGQYNVKNVEEEGSNKYQRDQVIGLRKADEVHVEFAPIAPPQRNTTRFTVEMSLVGSNPDPLARTGVIEFEYENLKGVQDVLLGTNGTLRYPETGGIRTMEMFDHAEVGVGSIANAKPFALFSAYAKTTHGGQLNKVDGSYASKPWSFHNHAALTASQNIIKEHPAQHSHELSLVRLNGSTDEIMEVNSITDRSHFITGHRSETGRYLGTIHELPLGPIQSLSGLNSALPAASYYLPRFTAPVGNSYAHPLLPGDKVLSDGPRGYRYADHCYLLNAVLQDGYYLSGFQGREGAMGDGKSSQDLIAGFFNGTQRLSDVRFIPHPADGKSNTEAIAMLNDPSGYRKAASHQMLQGAFNVNSTSVEAWKAMLSSMSGEQGSVLSVPEKPAAESPRMELESLKAADDAKGARFSRFRLPNQQPGEASPENYWKASRDLSGEELERLAAEIVREVRERGPFLSMSDFVNRQPGGSDNETLKGAIQAAIDRAGLNDNASIGGFDITESDVAGQELANPAAAVGPSAQGAPGYLMQADVLAVLGNAATVRSDTFVIRAYGDARDAADNITARAWCEAVVQRFPEYVDSRDEAHVAPNNLQSAANRTFGRRFEILSFRWLSSNEI